jgi:hypothetical protein
MQLVAQQTQHRPPAHFPGGPFSNRQARALALSNGLQPATAKDPLAPEHLKNAWEFKPCPYKLIEACRLAGERGLHIDTAEVLYRALGNTTCHAKTVGLTDQSLALAAWRRRDARLGHPARADSTYLAYWSCLLEAGVLVWGDADKPGARMKVEVANLVSLNGGRPLLEKMAADRIADDAHRQRQRRKKAALLGNPSEKSAEASVNTDVFEMSQHKNQKPLGFGFEFIKKEKSIRKGSTSENSPPEDPPPARIPPRRNTVPRPIGEVAGQQALEQAVSMPPPPKVAAAPPPVDLQMFAGVMALSRRVGKQAQARADAEDARPPPYRPEARPPAARVAPPGKVLSAADIAACIRGYAPMTFPTKFTAEHPLWGQMANLRLDSAAWDGIGRRMCAANLAKPIRDFETYLRACAARAYRDGRSP